MASPVLPQDPPKKSSDGTTFAIVAVCMLLVGGAVIGGVFYAARKVKTEVVEKAKTYGVELPSTTSKPIQTASSGAPLSKPCELLSKEEVTKLVGEPIEKAVFQDQSCLYYAAPGRAAIMAQEQFDASLKKAKAPGAAPAAGEVATAVDKMVNAGANEMPMLLLSIDPDGQAQMTAITAAKSIFGGFAKASEADKGGLNLGGEVKGVGDRAILMPKLGLNVLSGNTFVRVLVGPVADADAKAVDIAKVVLKKI